LKQIWPNFLIVGARNSGTSSLYTYLKQHPQVFMPLMKEPHYFSQLHPYSEMAFPTAHVSNEATYLSLFSKAEGYKAIGEASVSYLWDREAPTRIYAANPEARILILLRDPVDRAFSHYLNDVREGWQELPFFEALVEDSKRPKVWSVSHLYVDIGLYHDQVERYLDIFGPKRVMVLLSKELRRVEGRRKLLTRVADFLELDPAYLDRIDTSHVENEIAVARWKWSRKWGGTRWVRRMAQLLIPPKAGSTWFVKTQILNRFFLRPGVKPPMDEKARDWLCSIYEDDVAGLERLLGRDLPELRANWSPIEHTLGVSGSRS